MSERCTSRTVPVGTVPLRVLAGLLTAVLLAALLAPVGAPLRAFLLPPGADVPANARVLGTLPVADALVVSARSAPPGAVALDEPVGFQSLPADAVDAAAAATFDSGVASTRAPDVWGQTTGEDTVVALVDTGVAPISPLADAVAGEIDFTGTGGGDRYGHGTFMASLIAARGDLAPGVAPGTGILSLKVGDDDGASDLGTVLSALQWLYGPGRAMGVRIATLALGVDADSPAAQLLDLATARLAADGVLIVTAAGNEGAGTLTSPATSPGTFSVGAVDDKGTADRGDDEVADFSGSGVDRAGVAQPDVVASGVRVVGWMHEAAGILDEFPEAGVSLDDYTPEGDDRLVRGSGTSMSTAFTAGVAALALSTRPDLDGGDLAEALRAAEGELDAPTTLEAAQALPGRPAPPPGHTARIPNGKAHGWHDQAMPPARWAHGLVGAQGQSIRWASIRWASIRWAGMPWGHERWGASRWGSIRWASIRWAGSHWGDEDWEPAIWGSIRWAGDAGWQSIRWADEDWQSIRWADEDWQSIRWADEHWQSIRWASIRWASIRWATADWS